MRYELLEELMLRMSTASFPSGVFHYASLRGLEGILEQKAIWATEARFLNDTKEIREFLAFVLREIDALLRTNLESGAEYLAFLRKFILGYFDEEHPDASMIFISSFSEHGDLLSQWRGYCPANQGVSIGFSAQAIDQQAVAQGYVFGKCIYEDEQKKDIAKQFLEIAVAEYEKIVEKVNRRDFDGDKFLLCKRISSYLMRLAAFMKDPAFREEGEWRVVSSVIEGSSSDRVKFRIGSQSFIPYMEFPLPTKYDGSVLIAGIVQAPTPNPALAEMALRKLLRNNDIYVNPQRSSVPFRGN